jgi:hypothetical protein
MVAAPIKYLGSDKLVYVHCPYAIQAEQRRIAVRLVNFFIVIDFWLMLKHLWFDCLFILASPPRFPSPIPIAIGRRGGRGERCY